MASNLIPMLSSSPPPMDENGSFDDEDDDFGDFTCAGGVKVLDSHLNSPVKSGAPSLSPPEEKSEAESKNVQWNDHKQADSDEEVPPEKPVCQSTEDGFRLKNECISEKVVVFSEDVEELNCDEDEIDFGEEKQGLSAKYAFTHSELHDNTSQESVTDSGLCSSSQRSETSPLPPGEAMFPELSPETEVEEAHETFPDDSQFFYLKPDLELSHHSEEDLVPDSFDDTTTPVNEPQSFDDSLHISQTLDDEDVQDYSVSTTSKGPSLNLEIQNIYQCSDVLDSETIEQPVLRTGQCDSEETDDFADFACASFDPADESVGVEQFDNGFADFSQVSFDNSGATGEDSDWASFATSEVVPHTLQCTSIPADQHIPKQSYSSPTVQHLLDSAFPDTSDSGPQNEHEGLPAQSILGSEASHSCVLWRRLEDLDGSVSLQYQWSGSHSFQRTLQALNIDSRNVLHNSSVPLFALGLGELLEPVKLVQDEQPALFTSTTTTMPISTEQAEEWIPPAQFDWSSSGLVNPLDPSQSNSTLLDLDFFTNIENSNTSSSSSGKPHIAKASSLEAELLGMDSVCTSAVSHAGGGALVQKLLLSVPSSSSSLLTALGEAGGTTQLSTQAAGLLALLPDLSFMQAKVLMFPIRGTLDS